MPAGPGNSLDYQDDGAFNAFDTRVSKTVSGTTTTYKRGGAGVTDPVLSETTSGTTTAYTPGISEKRGSNATQYLHSGMKNADARTSGQTVDATRQYDAFGNLTGSSGTWNGPFGYAGGFGYQEDAESGLKLLGHRYYDSTTGRFLSKDPASSRRNWYAYCEHNPLSFTDREGLMVTSVVAGMVLDLSKPRGWAGWPPPLNLPRDQHGWPTPTPEANGRPHSQIGTKNSQRGPYPQAREFNDLGKPVKDIDFTDHGRKEHPNPHEHPYDSGGRRGGPRPLDVRAPELPTSPIPKTVPVPWWLRLFRTPISFPIFFPIKQWREMQGGGHMEA